MPVERLYEHERLYKAKRDAGPALYDVLAEINETLEQAFPALTNQPLFVRARALLASVDTHAQRGDSTQIEAPSPIGSAVPEADAHTQSAIK